MENSNNLKLILDKYKLLLNKQSELLNEIESKDYLEENEKLIKSLNSLQESYDKLSQENARLKDEVSNVKNSLNEQIIDEKLQLIKISKQKTDIYFSKNINDNQNVLFSLENAIRQKILNLDKMIKNNAQIDTKTITEEIDELKKKISAQISNSTKFFIQNTQEITTFINNEYDKIENEPLDPDIVQKRIKSNNLEIKIGLKGISLIGIILFLIGISTALQYTYVRYFTPLLKGISIFIISFIIIGVGEFLYQKNKKIFSLTLIGGGIGTLYLGVFHCYFNLLLFNLNEAVLISLIVTSLSIILSLRYNSQTISFISLIGGFIPIFTYSFLYKITPVVALTAIGYLFILNSLLLIISTNKRWTYINYVSFILNIPSIIFLNNYLENNVLSIIIVFAIFIVYLLSTMIYPFRYNTHLKNSDLILLFLNTITNCTLVYHLFNFYNYDFNGILAIAYCISYLVLGLSFKKYIPYEKKSQILFFITSYTFFVLSVPLMLGFKWFSIGWLVQSVLLIIFGYYKKHKSIEIGGWIINILCLTSALILDIFRYNILPSKDEIPLFHFRYLLIIIGMIIILGFYLQSFYKNKYLLYTLRGTLITYYKYFTIINLWIFSIYEIDKLFNIFMNSFHFSESELGFLRFLNSILIAMIFILISFIISNTPQIVDNVTKKFGTFLLIIANIIFLINTSSRSFKLYNNQDFSIVLSIISLVIIILYNIYSFLSLRKISLNYFKTKNKSIEILPIITSIYLLFITNRLIEVQFEISNIIFLQSLIYLIAALIIIYHGFKNNYTASRRFGLLLSIFAIFKLCLYDLSFLQTGGKIIAYISSSLILLSISYIYQSFSKKTF